MVQSFRGMLAALTLAVVLPAHAAASGPEAVAAGGQAGFSQATGAFALPRFVRGAEVQSVSGRALGGLGRLLGEATQNTDTVLLNSLAQVNPAGKQPVKELKLAGLLNRHLKTSLNYTLGGVSVWVSGAFDRAQKAFVSILVDGQAAKFFNVEEVFSHPAVLAIGSGSYKLSLSPDMTDQLESEIVLTNTANKKDQQRITLREMLAAVGAAGDEVTVGGGSYRVFYYDDVKGGVADPSSKSVAFILTDAKGEIHVFLIPFELIPADKIAIFKMHDSKPVGLQQANGVLRVFDNP